MGDSGSSSFPLTVFSYCLPKTLILFLDSGFLGDFIAGRWRRGAAMTEIPSDGCQVRWHGRENSPPPPISFCRCSQEIFPVLWSVFYWQISFRAVAIDFLAATTLRTAPIVTRRIRFEGVTNVLYTFLCNILIIGQRYWIYIQDIGSRATNLLG